MIYSKISGIGFHHPKKIVTNDDALNHLYKKSKIYLNKNILDEIITKARSKLEKAGSFTRFWCQEDEYADDLALAASQMALNDAMMKPEQLDLIIFTGMSRLFIEPASAHLIKHKLNALNANVFDMQDACTSFMKAMQISDVFIKAGTYKTILIVDGERTFDWGDFTCKTPDELNWKFGSLTIGDAGGAIILQATDDDEYSHDNHMRFFYKYDNDSVFTCFIGLNYEAGERYRLHSHSRNLFEIGRRVLSELIVEVIAKNKLTFDNFFFHDVGKIIINDNLIPFLKEHGIAIPLYQTFYETFGNIASASFPCGLFLAKNRGLLKRGSLCAFFCPSAGVQAGIMLFKY